MSYETYSLDWKGVVPPGGGDSNIKRWETNLGLAPAFFDPLKVNKTSLKTKSLHFFVCNSKPDLEG